MQCRSLGSSSPSTPPRISAKRCMLFTLMMLMSFSQQKACIRVKWICSATSTSPPSSVVSKHKTTLSESLLKRENINQANSQIIPKKCDEKRKRYVNPFALWTLTRLGVLLPQTLRLWCSLALTRRTKLLPELSPPHPSCHKSQQLIGIVSDNLY